MHSFACKVFNWMFLCEGCSFVFSVSGQPHKRLLMVHLPRTGEVEELPVLTSSPAALELLRYSK